MTIRHFLVSLIAGGAVFMCGQAFAAGFGNLSFMGEYNANHPVYKGAWKPFMDAAKNVFPGKNGLGFDYFPVKTLFPETESYAAVGDGRGDFVAVNPSLYPGKIKLLKAVAIPGICPNAVVGSLVAEDLIEHFPEVRAELPPDSRHFTAWTTASFQVHTVKPVKNAAELKGKKIIVWETMGLDVMKSLGAEPIRMSPPDTYLALSKGMADGVMCPVAPLRALRITESTKYHMMFYIGVNPLTMNINTPLWESLPSAMKEWIEKEGHEKMALAVGRSLYSGALADISLLKTQGHTFYEFTPEERKAALQPLSVLKDRWKESCSGIDSTLVESVLAYVMDRSAYHAAKMKNGEYGTF